MTTSSSGTRSPRDEFALESLRPDPRLFGEDAWEVASVEMWNRRAEMNFAMNAASAFRNITGFFKDRETCVPEWGLVCAGMIEKMAKVDFELDGPNLKRRFELVSKRPSFS